MKISARKAWVLHEIAGHLRVNPANTVATGRLYRRATDLPLETQVALRERMSNHAPE